MAVDLPIGEQLSVPPAGKKRLKLNADGAAVLLASDGTEEVIIAGGGRYVASLYGITPQNPDNGPQLNALMLRIRTSGAAGEIVFEGDAYDFETELFDDGAITDGAITLRGMTGTKFRAVGDLIAAGDLLTLDGSFNFTAFDIDFTSESTRLIFSRCIVVNGNANVHVGPVRLQNIAFYRCAMNNQFDGLLLQDNPLDSDLSVCGFTWAGTSFCRGFAAGGNVIDIASHLGVIINITYMTHLETPGVSAGNRPNSTVRLRDVADLRLDHVESVYARNGILMEPASGKRVNGVWMDSCVWGSVTDYNIKFAPNASAEACYHKWDNCWVDTANGVLAQGAAIKDLKCVGLTVSGCSAGVVVDAVTDSVQFVATSFSACTRGFWAKNSAKNFRFDGQFSSASGVTTTGWQVDLGCLQFAVYVIGGVDNCTTPSVDNSGAVSKSVVSL